jgi:cardiolipin synthase
MQKLSFLEEKSVENVASDKYKNKIVTIPNILSLFRIFLIPLIVWLFVGKQDYILTGVFVLVSGLTDIVDGYIARTFHMISDVGKVLDPVADKATQFVVMMLIATKFPLIIIPVAFLAIKEIFMAITGYMIIKKCDVVLGAEWYGKAATVVLSAIMVLHLFWYNIDPIASIISIVLASGMIILALVLYAIRNLKYLL